jgi:hypothetical protein
MEILMNTDTVSTEFETLATEALTALLGRVSAIKLRDIKRVSPPRSRFAAILAHIEVFGHSHILACEVNPDGEPDHLGELLRVWQRNAVSLAPDATPVLIAPALSPEAQAICKQSQVGFIDLEGNARLTLGDFFVVMRSMPRDAAPRASAASRKSPSRSSADSIFPKVLPRFSRKQVDAVLSA